LEFFQTMSELSRLVHQRQVSPVEIVKETLKRIDLCNDDINAFVHRDDSRALDMARQRERELADNAYRGPLHGIPFSVKDLLPVAGTPLTLGLLPRKDIEPSSATATVVIRLQRAGGIVIGKTNTSEVGYKGTTENHLFGPTANPWNHRFNAGGSSGGGAAAVALGLGSFAIATDSGGSIRIPASCCGVFGYKPSFGRIPYDGVRYPLLSHVGPLTRSVEDALVIMDAVCGWSTRDPYSLPYCDWQASETVVSTGVSSVVWSENLGFARVDPEVARLSFEGAGRLAEALNVPLGECLLDLSEIQEARKILSLLNHAHRTELLGYRGRADEVDNALVETVERAVNVTSGELVAAEGIRTDWRLKLTEYLGKTTLLVTPTIGSMPFPLESKYPDTLIGKSDGTRALYALTSPFNILNEFPAANVPVAISSGGLPVGLQVVGGARQDKRLLLALRTFERQECGSGGFPAPRFAAGL